MGEKTRKHSFPEEYPQALVLSRHTALLTCRQGHKPNPAHAHTLENVDELPALVHADENIAATNKLSVNVDLRYSRPVGIFLYSEGALKFEIISTRSQTARLPCIPNLDCLSQLLILQHIKAWEVRDAVHAQNLDHRIAESALRSLWNALHEQYQWLALHSLG